MAVSAKQQHKSLRELSLSSQGSLGMGLVALGLLAFNLFKSMTDQPIDFHGATGAFLIVGFLAVGTLLQVMKVIQGHRHGLEFVLTAVILIAHVLGDMAIWLGTQIFSIPVPEFLPYIIIALYVLLSIAEVIAIYGPREMQLFKSDYVSPEQQAFDHRLEISQMQQSLLQVKSEMKNVERAFQLATDNLSSKGSQQLRADLNRHQLYVPFMDNLSAEEESSTLPQQKKQPKKPKKKRRRRKKKKKTASISVDPNAETIIESRHEIGKSKERK